MKFMNYMIMDEKGFAFDIDGGVTKNYQKANTFPSREMAREAVKMMKPEKFYIYKVECKVLEKVR